MADLIPTILFYIFSALVIGSGVTVISAKNPVHSVFSLIFGFFNAAGLLLLLGAEYVAMTLIIVYVGAVAVLFLFVVMMLNVNFTELREGFLRYLPMGVGIAAVVFGELLLVFYWSLNGAHNSAPSAHPIPDSAVTTNVQAIGNLLYTYYLMPFQMAGVVLLIAMIGAIVLCHRERTGVRKQNINSQHRRSRDECVAVVSVESGKGI